MKIWLLRHGETEYNVQKRYLGLTDVPLSEQGCAALVQADFCPETVFVSPLQRTAQTARIVFPAARQIVVSDLREMDFGDFEGRTYQEMSDNTDYRNWVDSGCRSRIPNGEDRAGFCAHTCAAFASLVEQSLIHGADTLVIVAHGGTQMAVMERYAQPHQEYFSWLAPNGGGYLLDTAPWRQNRTLTLLQTVQYTKGERI